jgi:hypothetical protein
LTILCFPSRLGHPKRNRINDNSAFGTTSGVDRTSTCFLEKQTCVGNLCRCNIAIERGGRDEGRRPRARRRCGHQDNAEWLGLSGAADSIITSLIQEDNNLYRRLCLLKHLCSRTCVTQMSLSRVSSSERPYVSHLSLLTSFSSQHRSS